MRTRPHVDDAAVLATVRAAWEPAADAVDHLPVGFGAHHWSASIEGRPHLFLSLDAYGARHDAASLSAAYSGAATLFAAGLEIVHPCLEPYVVPLAGGGLSATRWLDGVRPAHLDVAATLAMLTRLHTAEPPPHLPRWRPLVPGTFADDLARRLDRAWSAGPHGESARGSIAAHADQIEGWTADYHHLAAIATQRAWVATHGEPLTHNQLQTGDGLRLVDWESLKLAPAERDLQGLGAGDAAMLRLFDLEWRLDEISQYATWFEAEHGDSDDDREALAGLLDELTRPDR